MIAERELSEYRALCTTLGNLHERFLKKKRNVIELLNETSERRKDVLLVLAKANRFTRHLTVRQRQMAGISYQLGEIKERINQAGTLVFQGNLEVTETSVETVVKTMGEIRQENLNQRELKRMGIVVIGIIDRVKKNLLQLDLLEKRCRELILSIRKALEAFRYEFRKIYKKIHPFGFFSVFYRSIRKFLGKTYFNFRDMDDVMALGNLTSLVLKIADSPLV